MSGKLDAAFSSLKISTYKLQEVFPPVLFSYSTSSTGKERGKAFMWALANVLKDAGINSFNGYQVDASKNWEEEWVGRLPECRIVIVMLSKAYFKSGPCINELKEAIRAKKVIIPLYLEEVDYKVNNGRFLGSSDQQILDANFFKTRLLSLNCIPPPDQGHFQGSGSADFIRNANSLVDLVKKILTGSSDVNEDVHAMKPKAEVEKLKQQSVSQREPNETNPRRPAAGAARKRNGRPQNKPLASNETPRPKIPAGAVFEVKNCPTSDWNGYYREKGTYNGKTQYAHTSDEKKKIYWNGYGYANGYGYDDARILNQQNTPKPPKYGWTDGNGSPISMVLVYV